MPLPFNMPEKISQKNVDELKSLTGKIRGEVFEAFLEYALSKEGKERVETLQEKMKEMGVLIKSRKAWINEGSYYIALLLAKDIFKWKEEDIFNLGKFTFRISFIDKIILRYFTSFEGKLDVIPKHWKKHYDLGNLEAVEYSKEEKYMIVRREGYGAHPLLCVEHRGFITVLMESILNKEDVLVEETKCMHQGEDYDEYKVTWK